MAVTKPHYEAEPSAIQKELEDGRPSYIIKPRGLSIVWGNDERYWKIPKPDKENEPVELIQVSWLEVTSSVKLEPNKKYNISFEVELALDAFGWRDLQVFLMAKVGKKGRYTWTKIKLAQDSSTPKFQIPAEKFTIKSLSETSADNTLHFGLYEVWSGKWKGGLKIHKATVTEVNESPG